MLRVTATQDEMFHAVFCAPLKRYMAWTVYALLLGVASCFLTFIIQRSFTLSLQYRPKFSPASTHCAVYIIRVAYSLHFLTDTLQSPVRSSGTLFLQSSVFAVWLLTMATFSRHEQRIY